MKTIKIMAIYIHKILCGHYIEQFSHRLLQKTNPYAKQKDVITNITREMGNLGYFLNKQNDNRWALREK